LARPHVRPHDVAALDARIRAGPDLRLEIALRRLVGHVDAGALAVELPAVIHAADPLALVPTEEERRPAVRAVILDQPEAAGGRAKRDQVLTEEADPDGRAVRLRHLAGHERGNPVLPDQGADRGVGPDATEELVVFPVEHAGTEPPTASARKADFFRLARSGRRWFSSGACGSTASTPSRSTSRCAGTSAAAPTPFSSARPWSRGCTRTTASRARSTTGTIASTASRSSV